MHSKRHVDTENQEIIKKMRAQLAGWLGGKYQLSRKIIPLIPMHKCYVEPFSGAAWVFFRKEASEVEVINDINKELITFYRVVQNHLEEFIRYFKWILVSRDEFLRLQQVEPKTLTDIQRAARFYYLQQNAFGGKIAEQHFGYSPTKAPKLNLLRIEEYLSEAHLRLSRAYIECLPYATVIEKYDRQETFFYIDPPYWDCENVYGKGIFGKEDFKELSKQLANIKGKFLLSLNDTKEIREIFSGFIIDGVSVNYSCSNNKNIKAKEVFIRNYEVE